MRNTCALILDMDGVIVDSNPVHTEAWVRYLHLCGVSADHIHERMHGKRNDGIVRDLFGAELTAEEVFRHGADKERLYREMMGPQLAVRLVRGVRDFISRHSHGRLAVASNAERANVDFVLNNSGLRGYFSVIVDGHQVSRPKPAPDLYLKAAEMLGVEPSDCVVFEDSMTGIEAARLAGAIVVGVDTTDAKLSGVDLLIRDFADPGLEEWLARVLNGTC